MTPGPAEPLQRPAGLGAKSGAAAAVWGAEAGFGVLQPRGEAAAVGVLWGGRKRREEGAHVQVGKGKWVKLGSAGMRWGGGQRSAAHVLGLCLW